MRLASVILILPAVISFVGCAPAPGTEESAPEANEVEAVRQADLAWAAAQASDGLDGTMSAYLDDAIMLPPNSPIVVGTEAIRAASAEAGIGSPGFDVSWGPTKIEVAQSGELAYAIGTNGGTVPGPCGSPIQVKGKYIEIWKKDAEGNWKIAADMFNSDLPPASASCE
jgi:ketosteroid isomerase-like protein